MASQDNGYDISFPSQPKKQKLTIENNEISEEKEEENRVTRSETAPRDWSKCFICKNKTYKKGKKMINVCTFEACDSVRKAAESKEDLDMLHTLRSVNYDLIAAEGKYHKNCFALYISKKSLKYQESKGDSLYENAFQEIVKDIGIGIDQGKAYDMASLLDKYPQE